MLRLRSYRLLPALLALSLVLTAATPLIRHSCGMTAMEMATKPCCKDKAKHDAPQPPPQDGMMAHGDAAMPCHDDTPPMPEPCPDGGPALHDACCLTVDAPTAPTPERVEWTPTALVALAASFLLPSAPPTDAHAPPPAESPPPAPVALHLLYGSFLT